MFVVEDAEMTGVETGVVSGVTIPVADLKAEVEEEEKIMDCGGVAKSVD